MTDQQHSAQEYVATGEGGVASGKGKGKATDLPLEDVSMGEDDDSSEEEEEDAGEAEDEEEEDEDDMQEIETENILAPTRRTEGKHVDYAKAAQDAGLEDDDDEDDDDDFEPEDNAMQG